MKMVLERIVTIRDAIKRPWWMFVIGGVVSVVCLLISFLIFQSSIGLFTTFLITIAMTPFMLNLITYEEALTEEEIKRKSQLSLIRRHSDILSVYTAFFLGMILSLSIIFIMLPQSVVQKLFEDQINEINMIRGSAIIVDTFQRILVNNVGVLFVAFVFSFLFGAGAIFILTWNASVLSTAIGLTAQSVGGIKGLPLALLIFFPHGSLEILAYFIGGIAGGLVSTAITRRKSIGFETILRDSLILMLFSLILLIIAAFVETTFIVLAK